MKLARFGKRGSLVIPSEERRKAEIREGDAVEVQAIGPGLLLIRKILYMSGVRRLISWRLPQWSELEGQADELLENET